MWTDLLLDQTETGLDAVRSAAGSADGVEAAGKAFDFLMRACPSGGPGEPDSRTRWHLGSSVLNDDAGTPLGYTLSLAWTAAGVVTNAAVYVSTTGSVHSTTLSARVVPRNEVAGSDVPQDASIRDVRWAVAAEDRLDQVQEAVEGAGYRVVPAGSEVLALLDVAEGRSAGFLGRVADPPTRLAGSLLIAEAHGQVSDWSGGFPEAGDDSLVAGSHFTHFQRLARLLAAARRTAAPAIDRQEVSRHA